MMEQSSLFDPPPPDGSINRPARIAESHGEARNDEKRMVESASTTESQTPPPPPSWAESLAQYLAGWRYYE